MLAVLVFRRVVMKHAEGAISDQLFGYVFFFARDPIATYKSLAIKVLLVSFLPDIAIGLSQARGATWPGAFALMTMHIAAWAVCVPMLAKLTTMKAKQPEI